MAKQISSKVRTRLIQAAVRLAHRHGFEHTTLAEIAKAAKVPPGNLYYYFKTKDEIGDAIVERRLSELSAMKTEFAKVVSPLKNASAVLP